MSTLWFRLQRAVRRASEIRESRRAGGHACATCGFHGRPIHKPALWPELIAAWELSPEWVQRIDEREGSCCAWCGSSLRSSGLAQAIVKEVNARCGTHATRLRSLFRDRRTHVLAIAEINSAGNLHRHLRTCPGLRYSEYGSRHADVPSENLMAMSFADGTFDLIITADTLEHVPDIDRVFAEVHRVLKPGGAHVFTTPVVWDRSTRQRATIEGGQLIHLLPPSHHGTPTKSADDFLVFYEFGSDFPERCERAGFDLELLRHPRNPAVVTFVSRRRS